MVLTLASSLLGTTPSLYPHSRTLNYPQLCDTGPQSQYPCEPASQTPCTNWSLTRGQTDFVTDPRSASEITSRSAFVRSGSMFASARLARSRTLSSSSPSSTASRFALSSCSFSRCTSSAVCTSPSQLGAENSSTTKSRQSGQ